MNTSPDVTDSRPRTIGDEHLQERVLADPELWATLRVLAPPAVLAILIVLGVPFTGGTLYAFAFLAGLPALLALSRSPEPLLALFVLYLPLCKSYAIPIAPGINGTNMFEIALLMAYMMSRSRRLGESKVKNPFSRVVALWAFFSIISFFPTMARVGVSDFIGEHALVLKAWLDQFIVFVVVSGLIRDRSMARRVVIYLMMGTLLVLIMGFQEWLDSRFLDSIEKSRLLGPQLQPNDFGAYLTYSAGPFIGLLVMNWTRWGAWLLVGYIVILGRLILATFSRGAYIGLGLAALAATYVRSKVLLVVALGLMFGLVTYDPSLLPKSLSARVGQTTSEAQPGEELDKSSETRIILWNAAIAMTEEKPIFGHGFGSFQKLKGKYTEVPVEESDNHNMYLYICSQMGIPALLVFLFLIWKTYSGGRRLYRASTRPFDKAIGLGAVAMAAGIVGVNMFGSRMVDIAVSGYYWMYLAALAAMLGQIRASAASAPGVTA